MSSRSHVRLLGDHESHVIPLDDTQRVRIHYILIALVCSVGFLVDLAIPDEIDRWTVTCALAGFAGLAGLGAWTTGRLATQRRRLLVIAFLFHLALLLFMSRITEVKLDRLADGAVTFNYQWTCLLALLFPLFVPGSVWLHVAVALLGTHFFWLWHWIRIEAGQTSLSFYNLELMTVNSITITLLVGLCALLIRRVGRRVQQMEGELRRLGSYELQDLLGAGGMGEVWRARHRMLKSPAAIKLIRTFEQDHTALVRFQREAQATAGLNSSNTIRIFDYGVDERGRFYYVMEMLDGIDLDTLITEQGPQPAGRVVHFLRQACFSLAEAHQAGLVHRDIKPANMFCCRDGIAMDHLKILDFGLVIADKAHPDTAISSARLTRDNAIYGTPEYISPEQAQAKPTDPRADIYSLGCVAFFLLTGRPVFIAESPMAILLAHVKDDPPLASKHSPHPVPPGLDACLLTMLQKDPADRPQNCEHLLSLFDRCEVAPWTQAEAAAAQKKARALSSDPAQARALSDS